METTVNENSPQAVAGATASTASDSKGAPPKTSRSRVSLRTILTSLLIVVLGTLAVGSTIVARRMADERATAQDNYWAVSKALDDMVLAVCTQGELKGSKMEAAREALLNPVVKYYQDYIAAHADDKKALAQLASANLRLAGLQAKLGREESIENLRQGMAAMRELIDSPASPDVYPSMQSAVLKVASQSEWLNMKNGTVSLPLRGFGVLTAFMGCADVLQAAQNRHPDAAAVREDRAAFFKAASSMEILAGQSGPALTHLQEARTLLEQLTREDPANTDYKARLAESLLAIARLQKTASDRAKRQGKTEELAKLSSDATAALERAVQLREELVAARPDDQTAKQDLTVVQRELQRWKPAEPEKKPDAAQPAGEAAAAAPAP